MTTEIIMMTLFRKGKETMIRIADFLDLTVLTSPREQDSHIERKGSTFPFMRQHRVTGQKVSFSVTQPSTIAQCHLASPEPRTEQSWLQCTLSQFNPITPLSPSPGREMSDKKGGHDDGREDTFLGGEMGGFSVEGHHFLDGFDKEKDGRSGFLEFGYGYPNHQYFELKLPHDDTQLGHLSPLGDSDENDDPFLELQETLEAPTPHHVSQNGTYHPAVVSSNEEVGGVVVEKEEEGNNKEGLVQQLPSPPRPPQQVHNHLRLSFTSDLKPRLRWTQDLHSCFVNAVKELGGTQSISAAQGSEGPSSSMNLPPSQAKKPSRLYIGSYLNIAINNACKFVSNQCVEGAALENGNYYRPGFTGSGSGNAALLMPYFYQNQLNASYACNSMEAVNEGISVEMPWSSFQTPTTVQSGTENSSVPVGDSAGSCLEGSKTLPEQGSEEDGASYEDPVDDYLNWDDTCTNILAIDYGRFDPDGGVGTSK
ncbi:hypothetical protein NC651_032764 [Populus alba x Populus x berolinensis]|nr:hypothetical protein NC651_032764 [Populus alba x Populus x berolinensis]